MLYAALPLVATFAGWIAFFLFVITTSSGLIDGILSVAFSVLLWPDMLLEKLLGTGNIPIWIRILAQLAGWDMIIFILVFSLNAGKRFWCCEKRKGKGAS